jgi:RimJ/RimL family protein N-acetyltransferase
MSVRTIVAHEDGIALTEPLPGDHETLHTLSDNAFAIERDDRPLRVKVAPGRVVVISMDSGELLGSLTWHVVGYGPSAGCEAWNIGIELLPSARGRGIGTVAQRLLVRYLFATTDIDRIEASTDVTNVAEQRALERVGFQREGVIRGAQLRGGVRHDIVGYGILRTDLSPDPA